MYGNGLQPAAHMQKTLPELNLCHPTKAMHHIPAPAAMRIALCKDPLQQGDRARKTRKLGEEENVSTLGSAEYDLANRHGLWILNDTRNVTTWDVSVSRTKRRYLFVNYSAPVADLQNALVPLLDTTPENVLASLRWLIRFQRPWQPMAFSRRKF